MKKIKTLLFFILYFMSCLKTHGQVTSSISEGCLPLTVNFTAPSGYSTAFWDFGDGSTSTTMNPTNTFLLSGTYTSVFKEFAGGPTIGSIIISVYTPPVPTFTANNSTGCVPLLVSFSDNTSLSSGISITGHSWVFNNGNVASGPSPNVLFTTPGSFDVSYEITTNLPSCNTSLSYTNVVNCTAAPNVSFTTNPSPPNSCNTPFNVAFQNTTTPSTGVFTYNWDFGNSSTSSSQNPPGQTYTTDGTYQVNLSVSDVNGCIDSAQTTVTVGEPEASFFLPDTVCIDVDYFILNQSPPGLYSWVFDAGTNYVINPINPLVNFTTGGYHDITLTILGVCPDDTTVTVFVQDLDPSFTSTPSFSCSEPMVVTYTPNNLTYANYHWIFNSVISSLDISNQLTPTTTYHTNDTTIYSINGPDPFYYIETILVVTSTAGCQEMFIGIDTLHEPNARLFPNVVEGCVPLSVTFGDGSISFSNIVNWEWHFGDGTIDSYTTSQNPTHIYSAIGQYDAFVIITNANGCIDTSYSVTISVGDLMTPSFSVSPSTVCIGKTVQFTDITSGPLSDSIDTWHYYSEDARQFSCADEQNPSWTYYQETGIQDITMVVGYNGCYSQATTNGAVTVNGPKAKINYTINCDTPLSISFLNISQDYTSVIWDFGDGNTSTTSNPNHTYLASGDYTVTLIASSNTTGCLDDTATILVHIRQLSAVIIFDTLVCQDIPFQLDANSSVDVYEACGAGYTWFFNDPSMRPVTTENSSHFIEFENTGFNEIMLVVRDINNCVDTAKLNINVFGITSNFSMSDSTICLPINVNFTDLSTSDTTITNWNWVFSDGTIMSNLPNPTYNFNDLNLFTDDTLFFELIVENTIGCTDTLESFLISYIPTSTITWTDNTICAGNTVGFTASSPTNSNLTYSWDFGDGNISLLQNPNNAYLNVGTYNVVMTFNEISSSCGGTAGVTVTVSEYPTANFVTNYDSVQFICPNDNVIFVNTSSGSTGGTYNWNFGNGLTSTFFNPGTVFDTNGVYQIQLISSVASPFGCADTITKSYIVQAPIGDFVMDIGDDTICRLGSVEFTIIDTAAIGIYHWDFGDGTGAGSVSPVSHQYTYVPPSGQAFAKLIMSNIDGSCPFTQDKIINIHEVVADFLRNENDIDTAICELVYFFTNTSSNANSFYWNFGDNTISNSENPIFHTYKQPGTYEVLLGVKNNSLLCTDTIVKLIVIFETPIIEVYGDTICEGDVVQIISQFGKPSYIYSWSSNPIYSINDNSLPTISDQPLSTTNYFLTVIDTNGCTISDETFVEVIPILNVSDFDTTIVIGDSIVLPMGFTTNFYTYTWQPEDGLSCTNCPYPTIQSLNDITYTLTISDIFGCSYDQAIFNISINPETFIDLPTSFTPNGDGVNDLIYVKGWGIKELIEYRIFNRWGELVFETSDLDVGWDGFYNGLLQNADIYVVQVKAITWKDEEKTFEGHINLIR